MKTKPFILLIAIFLLFTFHAQAQQVPDTVFTYPIVRPAYKPGGGPLVYIDQAHNNMHTREGGFSAFARLLEQDGYQVKSLALPITDPGIIKGCRILVIVNAIRSSNQESWALPSLSAFTIEEIGIINRWVQNGGRLFLIADHMPFAGAAYNLGRAFGFEFLNGFAFTGERTWPPSVFILENKTLDDSPIVTGKYDFEKIDTVATFTGS